jgi:hypothetical protein
MKLVLKFVNNMKDINDYLFWFKNLVIILWWKLLRLFGYRENTDVIPNGHYCYKPDYHKNEATDDFTPYYVIPCKYYKKLGIYDWNGCSYLGIITNDFTFADNCKLCNVNLEWDNGKEE